jgi:hypothetical protein
MLPRGRSYVRTETIELAALGPVTRVQPRLREGIGIRRLFEGLGSFPGGNFQQINSGP